MDLQGLRVIHHLKAESRASLSPGFDPARLLSSPRVFHLDSCQRQLWVTDADFEISTELLQRNGLQVHEGADAYLFLLRVATGLESQILGETDIFGQIKDAWGHATLSAKFRSSLGPWIQRLFEDTKEIRSQHLQNLGAGTYGSLVRKFVQARLSGPVLLVGAGQIARSVAPYLVPSTGEGELWLWNRSRENLLELYAELKPRFRGKIRILETREEEAEGWLKAACAVVCIPLNEKEDQRRRSLWLAGPEQGRKLIHLGGLRADCGEWNGVQEFHPLDDLFDLQKSQGEVRSFQIGRAIKACEERAKLRALGASVSLPHGWEDLAVFA